MLDFADLDMMARGGSLALLLLWSALLYRDHRSEFVARVALLMIAALCCHVLADIAPWGPQAGLGLFLLKVGQAAAPGLFWLFARAWFNDEDRIGWRSWLLIAVSVVIEGIALIIFGSGENRYFVIDVLVRLFWGYGWHGAGARVTLLRGGGGFARASSRRSVVMCCLLLVQALLPILIQNQI
jgi:hypothetical protein